MIFVRSFCVCWVWLYLSSTRFAHNILLIFSYRSDTQWSYWEGIKNFENKYHDYLQTQIGNPEGKSKPNKKYYDPRECMRAGEVQTVIRLEKSFADLKCQNILGLGEAKPAENVMGPRRGGLPMDLLKQ
jgi:fructose-bisphosphate aldolase class II